ncbi:hypothetical protein FisN_9Lh209 [Fistulifera solaris]|uniref:MINDY deubiquitinase domain-containing protein n=1 Tax=Fistulifera solaris TaxID=1519565 RepID=A0A1Z5KKS6_FISSO|nr:hypothetical protein FisN_9Lh209 [Fistulifera solaris]|eukprot:GAX26913.1 hypothetical protein FisN_9Lh209 [Fistulifera solaris]
MSNENSSPSITMVYRLKTVQYQNHDRFILLQNENGPCPLLAAANCLLLRGDCTLPSEAVRKGIASLDNIANMLAEHAMSNSEHDHAVYVDELMEHIPKFQFGMDVNPAFTKGITGYEYTAQLTAFDMLRCKLVHGWLVDITDEATFRAVGSDTYNILIDRIIHAQEKGEELLQIKSRIDALHVNSESELMSPLDDLQTKSELLEKEMHDALLAQQFLDQTSHQLTHYGLELLRENVQVNELCVFFRNNHFGTLTKHEDGHLYLLVTDLGYANSPAIVWERLDVIDGDTDYVNSDFKALGSQDQILSLGPTLTPEQMMAMSSQEDADYQLALELSGRAATGEKPLQQRLDEQEGKLMAAATEASLREYHGIVEPPPGMNDVLPDDARKPPPVNQPESHEDTDRLLAIQLQEKQNNNFEQESLHLACQLQAEEDQRAAEHRRRTAATSNSNSRTGKSSSRVCIVS